MIDVAVGIVLNQKNEVLIALRQAGQSKAGFWEFPGGKLESGETGEHALIRELEEEVNITPTAYQELGEFQYNYQDIDLSVCLYVYVVKAYDGELKPLLNQALKWVDYHQLGQEKILEASKVFLPELTAMLDKL
ncbi:MAG: 8-oxo-dGTP diphosphatase MutT [Gammaproteobacteria bacterium CG11_big_fil_rev_8_21_14_0_20_46_22]|nr:MAG: 8-oxo-dGTP diphosphatase MutT [Gammaproteobacteria bacterium CG12_big_fil_rev_8_21_14_0_65_46_12]PIR11236.1 MAG: 8-oxo-dGTP diphosphatase MutT [Gammaproteobacteria bacterium CG11_big_fil_rev_8_21_14_0_20_46_22]